MKLKQHYITLTTIFAFAMTLTACGGGSSGDGGTTTPTARAAITVDSSNAESITGTAYDGFAEQQNSIALNPTTSTNSNSGTQAPITVGKIANDYLSLKNNNQNSVVASAAITTGTTACNGGGSITVTNTSIAYANCRQDYFDGSYDITNGSASIDNLLQSGDKNACTESISGTFSFDNLTELEYDKTDTLINSTSINGGITFSSSQSLVNTVCTTTNSISGKSFILKSNVQSVSFFNFNIDNTTDTSLNYSLDYNITLDISALSGSLKFETISPIVGVETNAYPTSGHIRLTANSKTAGVPALIDIEIDSSNNGGEITLTVDVDGTPGTDVGYPKTMSWAEFEAL